MNTELEDQVITILELLLEDNDELLEEHVDKIAFMMYEWLGIYSSAGRGTIMRTIQTWLFEYSEGPQFKTYRGIPIMVETPSLSCCSTSIFTWSLPGGFSSGACSCTP